MKTYDVTVKSKCNAPSEDFAVQASNFEVAKKRARKKATANGWNALNSNLTINGVGSKNIISLW